MKMRVKSLDKLQQLTSWVESHTPSWNNEMLNLAGKIIDVRLDNQTFTYSQLEYRMIVPIDGQCWAWRVEWLEPVNASNYVKRNTNIRSRDASQSKAKE